MILWRRGPGMPYRARENNYIPFRNASAAPQATALLHWRIGDPSELQYSGLIDPATTAMVSGLRTEKNTTKNNAQIPNPKTLRTSFILPQLAQGRDTVIFENYDDQNYGYLRILVDEEQLRVSPRLGRPPGENA
jgi:hypothetical protein